ncbi:hypothetical protein MA16_Dca006238 [Dendrobium catenatum]|uniref:Uncharacterized protein n=1 Tax=Dendrobium catenatum TaxID=906689 RepID=A0A2I0W9B0_9ASPA|nr:hypothetical protein MA16_Dca006238 [Dendrobium catenatum]
MEIMGDTKELEGSELNMDLINNEVDKDILNTGMVSLNSNPCQISENRFQILVNEDMDEDVLFSKSRKPAVDEIICKNGANAREDVVVSEGILINSVCEGSCSQGVKTNSGNGDVVKSKLAKEIRSLDQFRLIQEEGLVIEVVGRRLGVLPLKKFNGIFSLLEL